MKALHFLGVIMAFKVYLKRESYLLETHTEVLTGSIIWVWDLLKNKPEGIMLVGRGRDGTGSALS